MTGEVNAAIHKTSAVAAVIAAILSPVPLADEVVLLGVYADLARRIGRAHGLGVGALPWRPIGSTALSGLAARAVVNLAVAAVPGVAAVANAASAVALTEIVGRYVDQACRDPAGARAMGVREVLAKLRPRTNGNGTGSAASAPAA